MIKAFLKRLSSLEMLRDFFESRTLFIPDYIVVSSGVAVVLLLSWISFTRKHHKTTTLFFMRYCSTHLVAISSYSLGRINSAYHVVLCGCRFAENYPLTTTQETNTLRPKPPKPTLQILGCGSSDCSITCAPLLKKKLHIVFWMQSTVVDETNVIINELQLQYLFVIARACWVEAVKIDNHCTSPIEYWYVLINLKYRKTRF